MRPPAAFLFDLDGTLYVHGVPVPGAAEALAALRRAGVPFRFVTNTTSRPRAALVELLRGFGIAATEAEVFTPITAAAALVRREGHRRVAPFLPEAALADLAGLELAGGVCGQPPAARPEAVLVGDLGERWSYALMQEAFEYLLEGALFVALSRDRYFKRGDRLALDAGPFVAGLEYAASRQALVAGKPSAEFFHAAVASLGLSAVAAGAVVMIGDDVWSDVRGAQEAGYQGWLVRTGKYREEALRESGVTPDRILGSIAELAAELARPEGR
jgi:HAD superfamily hydrolase (TIGR01458 family)